MSRKRERRREVQVIVLPSQVERRWLSLQQQRAWCSSVLVLDWCGRQDHQVMELGVEQNKFLRQFWTVVGAHLTIESSASKLSSLSVNVTLNWFRCVQLTAQNHRRPNMATHSAERQRPFSGILFISGHHIFGGRLVHWDECWLFQLQWLISKLQGSFCLLPPSVGIVDLYWHTQLLTWVLNLWTQVLLFAHWAPYCLKTPFQ